MCMVQAGTIATEAWKDVVGHEGWYKISSNGVVILVGLEKRDRKYIGPNGELKVHDNGSGYKLVQFRNGPRPKNFYLHRLVAAAFIPNPENKPCVGHKDHDRANNCVENLYWCTHAENTQHGVRDGKINAKARGKMNKLGFVEICNVAILANKGMGVAEIARKLGFPRTTISSVFNGRSNKELFELALAELK